MPVLGRSNLTLLTGLAVERLLFEGSRVTGIAATRGGTAETIFADTVVLCAGAVASPLLLMRSGIGAPDTLARAGVACRLDRPAVGENLHDHLLAAGNLYRARRPVPPSRLQHSESLMYLDAADPTRADGAPDVALACVTAPSVSECFEAPPPGEAYTILCGVTHPTSRGRLAITGPHLADAPFIDPAYLATEHDRRTLGQALRLARAVGHSAALSPWRAEEILPGLAVETQAQVQSFLARAAITHHHPVGTCRMGADAVVDADLKLNGLDNLHVVDASVIPAIPSGPVHACVLAIAETFCG
jgi:pyridoxine 4-oxidase